MKQVARAALGALTVALLAAPGPAAAIPQKLITIQSGAFDPAEVEVIPTTQMVWVNTDSVDHNVTGDSSATSGVGSPLASGIIHPGQRYAFTYFGTGTFEYRDALHPEMTGVIHVAEGAVAGAETQGPAATPATTPAPTPAEPGMGGGNAEIAEPTPVPKSKSGTLPNTGGGELLGMGALILAGVLAAAYWRRTPKRL